MCQAYSGTHLTGKPELLDSVTVHLKANLKPAEKNIAVVLSGTSTEINPGQKEPVKDQVFDNFAGTSGTATKAIENKTGEVKSAYQTLSGFLVDGTQGKGSIFTTNQQVTGDGFISYGGGQNGELTEAQFLQQMQKDEQKRQSQSADTYGAGAVQYSENKAKAVFTSIDANQDGTVKADEADKFLTKYSTSGKSFTRKENGEDITFQSSTEIALGKLPEKIQNATQTEIETKAQTVKTVKTGTAKLFAGGYIVKGDSKSIKEAQSEEEAQSQKFTQDLVETMTNSKPKAQNATLPMSQLVENLKAKGYDESQIKSNLSSLGNAEQVTLSNWRTAVKGVDALTN